jgi:hypothetical protein
MRAGLVRAVLGGVAIALLLGAAQPASRAAATESPATDSAPLAAAGWIARELAHDGRYSLGDVGITIDGLLALAGAGLGRETAARAVQQLADDALGYVSKGTGAPEVRYAGGVGKLLVAVLAHHGDVRTFGGLDLVAEVTALVRPDGRLADLGPGGFAASTTGFNQAWGVLGLAGLARVGLVDPAVLERAGQFIVDHQCPSGAFQDGGFSAAGAKTCAGLQPAHNDATALLLQALLAVDQAPGVAASVSRAAAVQRAAAHLRADQGDDGGFVDTWSAHSQGRNASSTGLAAQALRAVGDHGAASLAERFILDQAIGCDGVPRVRGVLLGKSGNRYGLDDGRRAAGEGEHQAHAQAMLALGAPPLGDLDAAASADVEPILDCPEPEPEPEPTTTTTTTTTTIPTGPGAGPGTGPGTGLGQGPGPGAGPGSGGGGPGGDGLGGEQGVVGGGDADGAGAAPTGPRLAPPEVPGEPGPRLVLGLDVGPALDPELPVEDARADEVDEDGLDVEHVADRGGPAELAAGAQGSGGDGSADGRPDLVLAGAVVLCAGLAVGVARLRARRRRVLPAVERLEDG